MLKGRFPNISGPHKEDICYATTNRQLAVKKVAPVVDALIVVGAPELVEFAAPARGRRTRGLPDCDPGAARRRSRLVEI